MEFRILGPLEVSDGGRRVQVEGRKQRTLLAVLLVHANEVVSADQLIDELWGEGPPPTAAKTLQAHVSRLRRSLNGDGRSKNGEGPLETRGQGYVLRVEPEQLDAERFQRLLDDGRRSFARGEPGPAAEKVKEALALWRGPALADFAYESFALAEIGRLEELRLAASEERIEANLALGRHAEVVAELDALVARQPLRERLRGQLMVALYRSDRQAEALEVYRRGRQALAEELGLAPGQALQGLERQILEHDPALAAPARSEAPAALALRRRPRLALLAGALVLAAAVGTAIFQARSTTDAAPQGSEPAIDPSRLRTIASERCSPLQYEGAGSPQLLIVADLPLQPGVLATTSPMVDAMTLALERRDYKAGPYRVGLQVCDDAAPGSVAFDPETCMANAHNYVENPSVIGVVGPFSSNCAMLEIPILNRAPGGPLAIVSPSNTYVGLTRPTPASSSDEPGVYYPTGQRNYARVVPPDDVQAAADAIVARRLGVKRVYALEDGYLGSAAIVDDFIRAARRLGIAVAGRGSLDAGESSYASLAAEIARMGADGVFLGVASDPDSVRLLRDLRARLGPTVQFMAADGFDPATAVLAGAAGEGMTTSQPGPSNDHLSGEGKQFVASFSKRFGAEPTRFALSATQAIDVLLDAIARSDGTRASVTRNLFTTRLSNGILGSFWITPTGDTTLNAVAIYRITGGEVTTYATVVVPDALVAPD